MPRADDNHGSLLQAIFDFYEDLIDLALLSVFGPPKQGPREDSPPPRVASLSNIGARADHPLEVPSFMRQLERRTYEGSQTGREDDVSDEFLAQLEQRTQQVKITLANLEAEKVRIEGLIAQLQPIVPHYDALVAAERQLSESNVSLEATTVAEPPPAEGNGWSTDPPGGEEPASEGQQSPGWSGSWNS